MSIAMGLDRLFDDCQNILSNEHQIIPIYTMDTLCTLLFQAFLNFFASQKFRVLAGWLFRAIITYVIITISHGCGWYAFVLRMADRLCTSIAKWLDG